MTENAENVEAPNETALPTAAVSPAETVAENVGEPPKPRRGRPPKVHAPAEPAEEAAPARPKLDTARRNAIDKALNDLTKKYGEGTIMRLGEASHLQVEAIPTGALALDIALGIGGIPRGRVTEIYGPESSGKTTLCQHIVAEAQKRGGVCGYIDMEHALDPIYATKCGVDVDNLYISQPDTGEQALEIAEALVRSGAMDVVVIDSVAALVPRSEIEGDMGDATMGVQARLMSQALRKLSGAIKQTNTAVIFTNQLRQKIGVMFGNPETTTGGMALKFYASVRLDVRRLQAIKEGGEVIGSRTRVRVTKNKVAPPFREAEFDILYNEGLSKEGDMLDLGTTLEIITKRGAFFSYNDTRLGQGREQAKQFLREHPAMAEEIELAIRAQHAATGSPLNVGGQAESDE
ncbi:MAG: recombinase RecA, partial [Anaerolineales bacterium]|nr:recombinase RecA [Anaerolineales bacterium]